MADKENRFPENVPGAFYIDKECIGCHLCSEITADFFSITEDGDHDFVCRQPETEDEMALCQEAMEACPVEAIGSDGE